MSVMGMAELEEALTDQLHLHSIDAANHTGIDHPNPQELTSDLLTDYQNHRLGAVSWFADTIPFEIVLIKKHHSVFIPAVHVMDRYITTCTDRGENLCQILKNIRNIRAACLSLALKMHAVFTEVDLNTLHLYNGWVNKALVTDSSSGPSNPDPDLFISSDVQGIQVAEMHIISTLRGAVFPSNADNMIRILCRYLILEHFNGKPSAVLTPNAVSELVTAVATKLLTKTALDITLLRFRRWKCIAVCCLLGVIDVCVTDPKEGLHVEDCLIKLLERRKPGRFTHKELYDLKKILTQGCVVCNSVFINPDVRKALLAISSLTCSLCKKHLDTDYPRRP